MRYVTLILAAFIGLCCTQAFAQSEAEGQQACGNDVFALCQQAIPDRGRIEACLRANFRRVSPTCRSFITSYAKSHRATREAHVSRHSAHSRHHRHHHHESRHHHAKHHHHSHD
jgi:hypothetical protein